jgi:hypothetical protein
MRECELIKIVASPLCRVVVLPRFGGHATECHGYNASGHEG